jgi:hypothetical protein
MGVQLARAGSARVGATLLSSTQVVRMGIHVCPTANVSVRRTLHAVVWRGGACLRARVR